MSIVSDVQELVNDTGVFYPIDQVYDAVNEAQLQLYAQTKWATTTATLGLNTNDDLVVIPSSVLIPQYLEYNTQRYFPTSHAKIEEYNRKWRLEPIGRPIFFVLWDAEHFRVWPRPDKTYDFLLTGIGWPAEISAGNTTITADRTYQSAVAFRAASILVEFLRPDLADFFESECQDALTRFKHTLRNAQSHNIRQLRPGTKFTVASHGVVRVGKNMR